MQIHSEAGERETPVITGMDLLTGFGKGVEPCWQALLEGRHAFGETNRFRNERFRNTCSATIPDDLLEQGKSIPLQMLDYLAKTAGQAPDDAQVFLASTLGEIEALENPEQRCTSDSLLEKALKRFHKQHGCVVSAACASTNTAIARAGELIRRKVIRNALIISCDYVNEFIFSGFACLRALAHGPAKPYDQERTGLTLGDAAGILVLTAESEAKAKGLPVLARITGWGMSCDAHHITAPREDGAMLLKAVRTALKKAGREPDAPGAVIGHGTGTRYNDSMEIRMLHELYAGAELPPLLSVKGACGHTLAGAGVIQTAIGIRMLQEQRIPPQTSLEHPETGAETMVSGEIRVLKKPCILTMNSGFGGLNAAILLEGPES